MPERYVNTTCERYNRKKIDKSRNRKNGGNYISTKEENVYEEEKVMETYTGTWTLYHAYGRTAWGSI